MTDVDDTVIGSYNTILYKNMIEAVEAKYVPDFTAVINNAACWLCVSHRYSVVQQVWQTGLDSVSFERVCLLCTTHASRRKSKMETAV